MTTHARPADPAGAAPTAGSPYATPEQRWAAVQARDRSADGAFVYAVSTTGVFCRPGCASRRPRREHVEFFDGASSLALHSAPRSLLRSDPHAQAGFGSSAAIVTS